MKNLVVEFKYRRIDRAMLDQIVGNSFRNNLTPPSDIIIKCKSATRTAYKAAEEYKKSQNVNVYIDPSLSSYEDL